MARRKPLTPRTCRKAPLRHQPSGRIARERPKLIRAREALGLDRRQLAEIMGRSRSYVWRVETGGIDPGLETIRAWLASLGPGASISLFEPHPQVARWSALVLRNVVDRQLVA